MHDEIPACQSSCKLFRLILMQMIKDCTLISSLSNHGIGPDDRVSKLDLNQPGKSGLFYSVMVGLQDTN